MSRTPRWLSPVYYAGARYSDFYWVSSPQAQHSRNIEQRPAVEIVIFDSTAAVGKGEAVYVAADATALDCPTRWPDREPAISHRVGGINDDGELTPRTRAWGCRRWHVSDRPVRADRGVSLARSGNEADE
jgi:hypothetical protein